MMLPRYPLVRGCSVVLGAILAFALHASAHAGIVGTEDVIAATQAAETRAQLKAMMQRPELAAELQALGATPAEAQARVDAMTDAEVVELAGKVGVLPAGGRLSNNELVLILVIVILILAL